MLSYARVTRIEWIRRLRHTLLPKGARCWYKDDDGLWWPGKNSAITDELYLVRFSDDPRLINFFLLQARYTTSTGVVRGSWYLWAYVDNAFPRGGPT